MVTGGHIPAHRCDGILQRFCPYEATDGLSHLYGMQKTHSHNCRRMGLVQYNRPRRPKLRTTLSVGLHPPKDYERYHLDM